MTIDLRIKKIVDTSGIKAKTLGNMLGTNWGKNLSPVSGYGKAMSILDEFEEMFNIKNKEE